MGVFDVILGIVGKLSTSRGALKLFRSFWTYSVKVMDFQSNFVTIN